MTATATDQFEVIVPTITFFTPETGSQFTRMTITGANFKDVNGGRWTVSVSVVSGTAIAANVFNYTE